MMILALALISAYPAPVAHLIALSDQTLIPCVGNGSRESVDIVSCARVVQIDTQLNRLGYCFDEAMEPDPARRRWSRCRR